MLATPQPQPPHLLNSFPAYHPTPQTYVGEMKPQALPPLAPQIGDTSSQPINGGGRGIKGLFTKSRVTSPEPDPTLRARLRSFIGDPKDAKAGPSKQASQHGNAPKGNVTSSRSQYGEQSHRPPTPDHAKKRIQFGPSLLPAVQKGEDGKWQPPSLSRGSLSTSAINMYAESGNGGARSTAAEKDGKGHKHSLSVLFNSKKTRARKSEEQSIDTVERPRPARAGPSSRQPPETPRRRDATVRPPHSSPASPAFPSPANSASPPTATITPSRLNGNSPRTPKSPPVRSSPTISSSPSSTPQPLTFTSTQPILSREHFLLRLATSYLIRSLTPVVRVSVSAPQNGKSAEMRRLADGHLATLARMEKGWGGDWAKAAAQVGKENQGDLRGVDGRQEGESNETKIREVHVSERAKERERAVWVEVMKDGVLLCLLLNHLFPSNPQHISRVNLTEDGILRATNLTRFHTACEKVGLDVPEIFGLSDLRDASEESMGRVAWTIIALTRRAGPGKAAVGRSMSPTPLPVTSPTQSRSPSRAGVTEVKSRTASPRARRPVSPSRIISPPTTTIADRPLSAEATKDLHAKLRVETARPLSDWDDLAYRTPTTSEFVPLATTPLLATPDTARRQSLTRSVAQPEASPLRPKSPSVNDSSRSPTPISRSTGRPSLRPRHTTGSRNQVSFADAKAPTSPNGDGSSDNALPSGAIHGLHSRERTPSLVSSNSRVISGYTRTSTVFSVSTVTGDDNSHAIDIIDESPDDPLVQRIGERRMSEKTLQTARQKLGALLSSDDLPQDLRQVMLATETTHAEAQDESRKIAISQSLAALEGWKSQYPRSGPEGSPRQRPPTRPSSQSTRNGEVLRVAEEDENSSGGGSSIISQKRPMIRRVSASGKTYVPRRTTSPSPNSTNSPITMAFPASTSIVRTDTTGNSHSADSSLSRPSSSIIQRRQSDGYPSRPGLGSDEGERPMNMRINSMITLSTVSDSTSGFRESMIRASRTQPLQVLEFNEPGLPAVKYQLGNCIGKGQFGSVYRSLNLGSGQMVAIKRIPLEGLEESQVKDVMHEVELLKRLAHPSIVKYEGMLRDDSHLNIVLEYVENGSLGQVLKAFGKFNERLASSYVAKILEGLDYLHSQGVVHCDLKAANILSTKNGNVKLSDFGVSLNMKAVENLQQDAATASKNNNFGKKPVSDVAGTPNWMAPEVISLNGAVPASDIWSLGCTIIELLTGKPPFSEIHNNMSVLFRIVEDEMPPLPPEISEDLTDFLKLCFIKNPEYRPAAVVLFEHPWVKKLNPDLDLRPQDSVPFLRRVSMDLRRIDSNRLFSPDQADILSPSASPSLLDSPENIRRKRHSIASSHVRDGSETYKEHELIKTTFGKAILCRICHAGVKKTGVLCQHCGLICHTACAGRAPPRCDVTEQLALLARQQEFLALHNPNIAISTASSRRTSMDIYVHETGTSITALPGRIFNGLKWHKSGSSIDVINDRKRRSSTNFVLAKPGTDLRKETSRPSLDAVHGRDSTSHSRASVFTDTSMGELDGVEGKRRSAIRFELSDDSSAGPSKHVKAVGVGVEEVGPSTPASPGLSSGRGNRDLKLRESKSDCLVM